MIIYGITAALFSYCVSLMVASPLAAFAAVAGYQFIMFIVSWIKPSDILIFQLLIGLLKLYLSSYLLVLTYGKVTEATRLITIIHFTTSIVAPVCSVVSNHVLPPNIF